MPSDTPTDVPTYRPCPVPAPGSGVSYVMPVLNEVDHLTAAVASVFAQHHNEPAELILALGPSTDGTEALAHDLATHEPRLRCVPNPATDIPVGLNVAIAASHYPTVVRVDAHTELPPHYTAVALKTLAKTKAANVGGRMHAEGLEPFQSAVARAYNSKFGLGGQTYHVGGDAGLAESAYLGVFRRVALNEVGGYDPGVRRGEDWELNLRLRDAGFAVWFDPDLEVTYRPRSTWRALVKQFYASGSWRGELVRRHGMRNGIRYFAPAMVVLAVAAAVVLGALAAIGVVAGLWMTLTWVAFAAVGVYVAAIIAVVAGPDGGSRWGDRWRSLVVFPSVHLAWGSGFLRGVLRGAGDTIDRSRVPSA